MCPRISDGWWRCCCDDDVCGGGGVGFGSGGVDGRKSTGGSECSWGERTDAGGSDGGNVRHVTLQGLRLH